MNGRRRSRKYQFLLTVIGFFLLGLLLHLNTSFLRLEHQQQNNKKHQNDLNSLLTTSSSSSSSLYYTNKQIKKNTSLYYIFDSETKEPSSSSDDDDDDTPQPVWIVKWIHKKLFNKKQGNEKCDIITERIQNRLLNRKNNKTKKNNNNNNKLPPAILIIDRGDTASFHKSHCPKRIASLVGSQNLYLAVRNMVVNRNFGCMSIVKPTCYSESIEFTNLYGVPWNYTQLEFVKYIHNGCIAKVDFPVRNELLTSLRNTESATATTTTTNKNNNKKKNIQRIKDVAHFWDIEPNNRLGQLRNRVTETLSTLIRNKNNNITGTVGLVSKRAKRGRTYIDQAYVNGLLEHKIIVVAQRDHWEGHLRLMEAMISGGLVLSDPIIHPPSGMVNGTHFVIYTSLADLKDKVLFYSSVEGSTERERIARAGKKLVLEHHKVEQVYKRMVLGNWPKNCSEPVIDLLI